MQIRIIETPEDFRALREPWNKLVDRLEHSEPFFCWEWANAHIEHGLTAKDELFIIAIESGSELTAIAPLCIQREGFGPFCGRVVKTVTGDHADYGSFYLHPETNHRALLKKIFGALCDQRDRWDMLHLLNFSSRNPQTFLIADVAQSDYDMKCMFREQVLTPFFRFGGNDPKIVRKELKNIERRERNLREAHEVEITIGGKFTEEFWVRFLEFHLDKWPESIFRDPANEAFARQVIADLEPLGKTEFSWMKIDGEFAAMHYGFQNDRKVGYYIPVYDKKYHAQGVGKILLKHLIDRYSGEKQEFDFLRGNEPYKFNWTDSVAANHNLLIQSGSASSRKISHFLQAKDQLRGVDWLRKFYRAAAARAAL